MFLLKLVTIFCLAITIVNFSLYVADTECPNVDFSKTGIKDRRADKNKLRVVQYNVEWLFVDYCNSSDCPGNGCTWKNQTSATKHLQSISKIISELNPDIINLCEVEGCDELNMLTQNLNIDSKDSNNSNNLYQPYLKKGKDTSTGQNVGILTKIDPMGSLYRTEERYTYPIAQSTCNYTGETTTSGVSKHYITEFIIKNIHIAFIGAHLVAFPTEPQRCAEREAQAMVLQKIIYDYIQKTYEVIFLGDLNDYDGETLDANDNKPTSHVLQILKGEFGDYQGKYDLHNVAEWIVEKKDRYSAWWDKNSNCISSANEFSSIDHMLVTKNLLQYITQVYYYHGYLEKCNIYESDHYPLVVDFQI